MTGDFLFQAFVYLSAAVISVPIAKRLGLSQPLGLLRRQQLYLGQLFRLGREDRVWHGEQQKQEQVKEEREEQKNDQRVALLGADGEAGR